MDPGPSKSFRNKALQSGSKHIIYNVIKFCEKEALDRKLSIPISHFTKRASEISGVSETTIRRIRRQSGGHSKPQFISPKKREKKETIRSLDLDHFDCDIIRRTIHDFYVKEKTVPTISKLIPILKDKINFPWQRETLRKILHEIGFRWKKSQKKKQVLTERSDIILSRTKYLRNIERFRTEGRPLVYLDQMWLDSNLTFDKCWRSEEISGVSKTGNASRCIIVLCAGGEMGFIPNTSLIMYKVDSTTGYYHRQMNSSIFEKWTKDKLIPNLPKDAVVIIDNASYHSVQVNKPPNLFTKKQDIMEWLSANNVPYSSNFRKVELLGLVKRNTPQMKYKFDNMLAEHGFQTLRLPPYHCDINAIEFVWADMKQFIRSHNISGDIAMSQLLTLMEQAISSVTVENWRTYCSHVASLEKQYWEKDGLIEDLCEPLLIHLDESDDDSEVSTNESSSEEDVTC